MNRFEEDVYKRAEDFINNIDNFNDKMIRVGSDNFHKAMKHVLKWEGGYVNHPNDPGGETKFGISKRAYPHLNIKELTEKDVYGLYYFDYWRPLHLDDLPFDLAASIFDAAVNVGVTRVRSWLKDLEGLNRHEKGRLTAAQFNDRREKYYKDLVAAKPEMAVFEKGWMNRLNSLREFVG